MRCYESVLDGLGVKTVWMWLYFSQAEVRLFCWQSATMTRVIKCLRHKVFGSICQHIIMSSQKQNSVRPFPSVDLPPNNSALFVPNYLWRWRFSRFNGTLTFPYYSPHHPQMRPNTDLKMTLLLICLFTAIEALRLTQSSTFIAKGPVDMSANWTKKTNF